MRDLYLGKIVDIDDPSCEFIRDMDDEISNFGAIVYNHDSNSYQFIRHFKDIDYKKELLPDFLKVEDSDPMLKGLNLTIHYEFDPEDEEDEENLKIWQEEISKIELPYYNYDSDGEIYSEKYTAIDNKPTTHTLWFLNENSYDYILDCDLLMISPIIKNLNIARNLIKNYSVHPMQFTVQEKQNTFPQLEGVFGEEYDEQLMNATKNTDPLSDAIFSSLDLENKK